MNTKTLHSEAYLETHQTFLMELIFLRAIKFWFKKVSTMDVWLDLVYTSDIRKTTRLLDLFLKAAILLKLELLHIFPTTNVLLQTVSSNNFASLAFLCFNLDFYLNKNQLGISHCSENNSEKNRNENLQNIYWSLQST